MCWQDLKKMCRINREYNNTDTLHLAQITTENCLQGMLKAMAMTCCCPGFWLMGSLKSGIPKWCWKHFWILSLLLGHPCHFPAMSGHVHHMSVSPGHRFHYRLCNISPPDCVFSLCSFFVINCRYWSIEILQCNTPENSYSSPFFKTKQHAPSLLRKISATSDEFVSSLVADSSPAREEKNPIKKDPWKLHSTQECWKWVGKEFDATK